MADSVSDKGYLQLFLNTAKRANDKRPLFEGRIVMPGRTDERNIALWGLQTKAGHTMLTGRAGESAQQQIEALTNPPKGPLERLADSQTTGHQFAVDAHQVVLFQNLKKTGRQPDYWGYYNPGPHSELMRLNVWAKTDRAGKAMLTGGMAPLQRSNDQEPLPDPERSSPSRSRSR